MNPSHVAHYKGFVAGSRKCRADNVSRQSGPSGKKVCQQQQLITGSLHNANLVTQSAVNRAIANLVIGALLRIVEVQEFKDLIATVHWGGGNINAMSCVAVR